MLFPPIDPNERFRERRAAARRRVRLRRGALIGALLAVVAVLGAGAQFVDRGSSTSEGRPQNPTAVRVSSHGRAVALPVEVRGVHVSMGLASLPGKLEQYLDLQRDGLTALELDVKDEHGQIGFTPRSVPLAREVGAARNFYSPREAVRLAHERGIYLIGRVVVFEDPTLALARPDLAVHRSDGSVWRDDAGLAWVNPYDRRVWRYDVGIAEAAAEAGFDEILFDYVRFPSDGNVADTMYAHRGTMTRQGVIPAFFEYAEHRLQPLGVHVSAAVFGLSATRDLGIGQVPRRIAPHVDAVYPMTYPSLFGPGELGLTDPSATPGETVSLALGDFRRALRGDATLLVPWVQDFTLSRPFGSDQVRAQIEAARLAGAKGYMLWNPEGVYSSGVLSAP